jgi:hypothetical protein
MTTTTYQILGISPNKPEGLVKKESNLFYFYDARKKEWVMDSRVAAYFVGGDTDGTFVNEESAVAAIKKLEAMVKTARRVSNGQTGKA